MRTRVKLAGLGHAVVGCGQFGEGPGQQAGAQSPARPMHTSDVARVLDLDLGPEHEHPQALEDGGQDAAGELQVIGVAQAQDAEAGQQAPLGAAMPGELGVAAGTARARRW